MKIIFVINLSILLSCTPTAYHPSNLAPPHFSKDGRLQATITATASADYAFQLAFSPVNHLGLFYVRNGAIPNLTDNKRRGDEFGLGTYYWIANNYYMSLYGGYSNGYVDEESNFIKVENKYSQYSSGLVFDKKHKNGYTSVGLRLEWHKMRNYYREDKIFGKWSGTFDEPMKNIYWSPSIGRTYITSSGAIQIRFVGSIPTKESVDDIHFYISGGLLFDFKLW